MMKNEQQATTMLINIEIKKSAMNNRAKKLHYIQSRWWALKRRVSQLSVMKGGEHWVEHCECCTPGYTTITGNNVRVLWN